MPGNQAPDAVADGGPGFTTDEDTPITVNLLSNDTDPDGDTISISSVGTGSYGFAQNNSGTVTYTPFADWMRPTDTVYDTISYTITDGRGGSDSSTFRVRITGVNDKPRVVLTVQGGSMMGLTFHANQSSDLEFDTLTFAWEINGTSIPVTDSSLHLKEYDLIDLREFVGSSNTIKVIVTDGIDNDHDEMTIDFMLGDEPPVTGPNTASALAPPTTWDEWRPAANDLDISGRQSPSFVQNALGKFGGQWALTTIPTLSPGGVGDPVTPIERKITEDSAAIIKASYKG